MDWLKKNWLIIIAVALFAVAGGIFAVLMDWWSIITPEGGVSEGDLLRSLILCIGAIGGVYGLHIAAKRQEKFSNQVDVQTAQMQVQADQSFNDRLGRGVELLAKDNVVMRCTGLQVLEDLADNVNDRQRAIVLNIIYNFFRDNAKINIEDGNKPRFRTREDTTQDLQDALDILISLSLNDREKLLPKRFGAGRLNFCKLDFSHLVFANKKLESVDFSKAIMDETSFVGSIIKNVNFLQAKIRGVDFSYATIKNSEFGMESASYDYFKLFSYALPEKSIMYACDFFDAIFNGTKFCNIIIEATKFSNIKISGNTNFKDVEFWQGIFYCQGITSVESDSNLPFFIGTDLGDSDFQFANVLDSNKFFEFCYTSMGEHGGITPFIDESRVYRYANTFNFTTKVFVESDKFGEPWNKPWSGQPVREWVALECANKKLKQAEDGLGFESDPNDVDEAKVKVYEAEGSLDFAQSYLGLPEIHSSTPQPKPKAKKPKPKAKKPKPNLQTPK